MTCPASPTQQALRSSHGASGPRPPAAPEHGRADSGDARAGAAISHTTSAAHAASAQIWLSWDYTIGSLMPRKGRLQCRHNFMRPLCSLHARSENPTSMAVMMRTLEDVGGQAGAGRHLGEGAEVDDAAHGLDAQRLAVAALQAEAPVQAGLLHSTASVQWTARVGRAAQRACLAPMTSRMRTRQTAHAAVAAPPQSKGLAAYGTQPECIGVEVTCAGAHCVGVVVAPEPRMILDQVLLRARAARRLSAATQTGPATTRAAWFVRGVCFLSECTL